MCHHSFQKLVLRSRPSDTVSSMVAAAACEETEVDADKSLTIGLHDMAPDRKKPEEENDTTNVDDSFAALNTRKKAPVEGEVREEVEEEAVEVVEGGEGVVTLTRAGYYTMPALADLLLDADGACMVTGFTIGREGYGNIHYPGNINVAGLDLDENVFIRHKEVVVYPDDASKPPLGEGLNRKAQITLDKVWPTDKASGDTVRSPTRLRSMAYEEKLERASGRLGAKFIEYRPETGSWVFKVDHFSKYGLDDSDGEEVVTDNVKKFKTLEKRPELKTMTSQVMDNNAKNIVLTANDNMVIGDKDKVETDGEVGSGSDGERDVEMEAESVVRSSVVRSALFGDEMDTSTSAPSFTKPVILQQRVASLSIQPRLIENIANSVLGHSTSFGGRGLGGINATNTSNLGMNVTRDMSSVLEQGGLVREGSRVRSRQVASYTLQAAYDNFVPLATSGSGEVGAVVVPRYQDAELPLERSLLAGRWGRLADCGLTRSKAARAGWAAGWDLVTVGAGLAAAGTGSCLGDVSVSGVRNTTCGPVDAAQLESLERWFETALATSTCEQDEVGGPVFGPAATLDTLHSHAGEAARQRAELGEGSLEWAAWVEGTAATWQLMVALWGRLEAAGGTGEETVETHRVTVARRDALSAWLRQTVGPAARREVETAQLAKNPTKVVLANLSGGQVSGIHNSSSETGTQTLKFLFLFSRPE